MIETALKIQNYRVVSGNYKYRVKRQVIKPVF